MKLERIDLYVLRQVMPPLLITVIVAVMLFLLDQMLRLFDFVLVQNGPVELVWRMLAQLLPQYLSHGVSLGLFVGVLLGFRQLSLSSELDALASGGVSLKRLMRPVYGLALLMMALNYVIIAYVQPLGFYRYHELRYEAAANIVGAKIKVGQFLPLGDGATLRVGGVENGGNILRDVFLERCGRSGRCIAVTAESGSIAASGDWRSLILRLNHGQLVDLRGEKPNVLIFETHELPVDLPTISRFRERGADEREATINELISALSSAATQDFAREHQYRAALHWRILHTLSFMVIPLAAVAMGIADRRRPTNAGPIIGIAVLVIYNEVLEFGQRWSATGAISPWLGMWPIFFAFCWLGFLMFRAVAEVPGGHPLAVLKAFNRRRPPDPVLQLSPQT